ncbi:protein NEN1 [Silene latifolia]|uniref:protein NEN1 n=1 Tax=Silene latifolia TaxID=37657 RepID=UPI003D780274
MAEQRSEIAFFDVETTIPFKQGQGFALLEFGVILVCPQKLIELDNYSTLIRPRDPSLITPKSERCNGISRASVSSAPSFADVADKIFDLLNGRIWAGHNILRFDCFRIREAFAEVNRPPPEPKGVIDSLALLTERFGRRAGNMKMATLATYFGLGQQTHRSLDDVRMNLEVLKYCATVLFLESSLPEVLMNDSWVSPSSTSRRTRSGGRVLPVETNYTPNAGRTPESNENQALGVQILSFAEPSRHVIESFDLTRLSEEIMSDAIQPDNVVEERPTSEALDTSHSMMISESSNSLSEFLAPDNVSISSIAASWIPIYWGSRRIQLLHNSSMLKLHCTHLKVRFGISTKFVDQAGRRRLSFVVDAPPSLSQVLDACDSRAQSLFVDSDSTSEWRPLVSRKNGYWNSPTVRLHIPTVVTADVARYGSEIFQKEASSGAEQKLIFSKFDPGELESLFVPGTLIDAFISLDQYDYQQNAGIRLVAVKLVIHSP